MPQKAIEISNPVEPLGMHDYARLVRNGGLAEQGAQYWVETPWWQSTRPAPGDSFAGRDPSRLSFAEYLA